MTPAEMREKMLRFPATRLPMPEALEYLSQCANSWLVIKPEYYEGYVNIGVLRVPADKRREGYGTAIMLALTEIATVRGWTLTVTPSVEFGATSVARLERFYGRFGFTHNRRSKRDFSTSATMIRNPVRASYNDTMGR